MAILFLKFSQMSFSEWGGVGIRIPQRQAAVLAASLPLGEPPALEEFGARAALFSQGTYVMCLFAC